MTPKPSRVSEPESRLAHNHQSVVQLDNPLSVCLTCSNRTTNPKFCSKSCSASYSNARRVISKTTKQKVSETLKRKHASGELQHKTTGTLLVARKVKHCVVCSHPMTVVDGKNADRKTTCSKSCAGVKAGRASASARSDSCRSKNEVLFSTLCGTLNTEVKCNEQMFNGWDADVILPEYKVAILWNGKWHYEKITKQHSVIQVQNRDKIKLHEIQKFGYTPYVIKDMGRFNTRFVFEQFEVFKSWLSKL